MFDPSDFNQAAATSSLFHNATSNALGLLFTIPGFVGHGWVVHVNDHHTLKPKV